MLPESLKIGMLLSMFGAWRCFMTCAGTALLPQYFYCDNKYTANVLWASLRSGNRILEFPSIWPINHSDDGYPSLLAVQLLIQLTEDADRCNEKRETRPKSLCLVRSNRFFIRGYALRTLRFIDL